MSHAYSENSRFGEFGDISKLNASKDVSAALFGDIYDSLYGARTGSARKDDSGSGTGGHESAADDYKPELSKSLPEKIAASKYDQYSIDRRSPRDRAQSEFSSELPHTAEEKLAAAVVLAGKDGVYEGPLSSSIWHVKGDHVLTGDGPTFNAVAVVAPIKGGDAGDKMVSIYHKDENGNLHLILRGNLIDGKIVPQTQDGKPVDFESDYFKKNYPGVRFGFPDAAERAAMLASQSK